MSPCNTYSQKNKNINFFKKKSDHVAPESLIAVAVGAVLTVLLLVIILVYCCNHRQWCCCGGGGGDPEESRRGGVDAKKGFKQADIER